MTSNKLLRMDNVLLVVDDLKAAIAFFTELGLELEGETTVEGQLVDRIVGLDGVRSDIAIMRTPDGHGAARAGQVPHAQGGQGSLPVFIQSTLDSIGCCRSDFHSASITRWNMT